MINPQSAHSTKSEEGENQISLLDSHILEDELSTSSSEGGDDNNDADRMGDDEVGRARTNNKNEDQTQQQTLSSSRNVHKKYTKSITDDKLGETDERPVIVLPNGIILHNKLSMSISIHHATIQCIYAPNYNNSACSNNTDNSDGYFQIVAKGCITELIWPKVTQMKGGYIQSSLSYVAIEEQYCLRRRALLVGGISFDDSGPLEEPSYPLRTSNVDDTFPLYEDRALRPDPLGLRFVHPSQAIGFKMSLDYISKNSGENHTDGSKQEDIQILTEIGIDRFDVALDPKALFRILRFAMNLEGGGFDSRWHSGDWSECLLEEMLVDPDTPLNLDDVTQPSTKYFLCNSPFILSDLMNATIRITKFGLRIPAAVTADVRSCDLRIQLDDSMITVSSALPRTLLDTKINQGLFPNDRSDVVYIAESYFDTPDLRTGEGSSITSIIVRTQVTVRGFSIQLMPMIPYKNARLPQELLAPTELTMIVSFELQRYDTSTDHVNRILLLTSIYSHGFKLNLDFDYITSLASTIFVHTCTIVEETKPFIHLIRKTKGLSPESESITSSAGAQKTTESHKGRKARIIRHVSEYAETGSVTLALDLQIQRIEFCVWRQNVPRGSLIHFDKDRDLSPSESWYNHHYLPLLKLLVVEVEDLQLGIEARMNQTERRFMLKFNVSDIGVNACDFRFLQENDACWCDSRSLVNEDGEMSASNVDDNNSKDVFEHTVDLIKIGSTPRKKHAFAIRIEDRMESSRSWSVSMNLCDGVISLRIEELELVLAQFIGALLAPTWSNLKLDKRDNSVLDGLFPEGSNGHFLAYLLTFFLSHSAEKIESLQNDSICIEANSQYPTTGLTHLANFASKIIPPSVEIVLVRLCSSNSLVHFPERNACSPSGHCEGFGLCIGHTDSTTTFFKSESSTSSVLDSIAFEETSWNDILQPNRLGLYQSFKSRLSMVLTKGPITDIQKETLGEEFDCGYTFSDSKLAINGMDSLSVENLDGWKVLVEKLTNFVHRFKITLENVTGTAHVFSPPSAMNVSILNGHATPLEAACSAASKSILTVQSLLQVLSQNITLYESSTNSLLVRKEREIDAMRLLVFAKEKERLGALALVSCEACGWLRMGAAQKTGQRGLMTSLLWPQWTVLRRSLLLIYADPRQCVATDIICLQDASLLEVTTNQRKIDVKRAFALVECTGMTYFFVAGNDSDYLTWTREIHRAISWFSSEKVDQTPPSDSENGTDSGIRVPQQYVSQLDISTHSDISSQGTSQKMQLGKSLTRAVQIAKAKSQAAVDRSLRLRDAGSDRDRPKHGVTFVDHGSLTGTVSTAEMIPSDSVSTGTSVQIQEMNSIDEEKNDSSNEGIRRQQFRSRFAGVSQVTKKGLGSALQATRQKAKEVAEKRRHRLDSNEIVSPQVELYDAPTLVASDRTSLETSNLDRFERTETSLVIDRGTTESRLGQSDEAKDENGILTVDEKRNQLRSRFAGVGQVTKKGFGTALQATKQKAKEAAEKRRQKDDTADKNLPSGDSTRAATNQTPLESKNELESEHVEGVENLKGQNSRIGDDADDQSAVSELVDENDYGDGRVGMRQLLGAVVRNARENRRINFRRRGTEKGGYVHEGSDGSMMGGQEAIRLRSISLKGPLQVPVRSVWDGRPEWNDMMLEKIVGCYYVEVEAETVAACESFTAPAGGIMNKRMGEENADNVMSLVVESVLNTCLSTQDANQDESAAKHGPDSNALTDSHHAQPSFDECSDGISTEETSVILGMKFRIRVFEETEIKVVVASDVVKTLPDIISFHTMMSEVISRVPSTVLFRGKDIARSSNGAMTPRLEGYLGLTTLDAVRLTGRLLGGLLSLKSKTYSKYCYHAEIVSEFLNSMLTCPLPVEGLIALKAFLSLSDAAVQKDNVLLQGCVPGPVSDCIRPEPSASSLLSDIALVCQNELMLAANRSILAAKLGSSVQRSRGLSNDGKNSSSSNLPASPSASKQYRDSMHTALVKVMEERDEAHTRMVAAEVLNLYQIEEQRKVIKNISNELDELRSASALNGPSSTRATSDSNSNQPAAFDNDAELVSLCQQLSGEISARTYSALEILRLKETRIIEQTSEEAEKKLLQDEIAQLRNQLAEQKENAEEARRACENWKESFEALVKQQDDRPEK